MLLIFIGTNYYTYTHTREAHHKIGLNSGIIQANLELQDRLLKILENMPYCKFEQQTEKNLILDFKALGIYITESNDNSISFCQS